MVKPIAPHFHAQMNTLARMLDTSFNPETEKRKVGFVLLCFDFGDPDGVRMNYISNAKRDDMVCALKELVARFEGRAIDVEGHA